MRIERIRLSRRKKDRLLVFLEDGTLLRITQQELLRFALRPGDELDEKTLSQLKEAAELSQVKAAAAAIVGRRAISRQALEKKLMEKGATQDQAQYAGERMEAIGAIDDAAYAAALVRHCGQKGYGVRRTRQVLWEKRVPEGLWEEALRELPESRESIQSFLEKKLQGGRTPEAKEKKRLTDALLRRGFSWGEIRSAWRSWEEA